MSWTLSYFRSNNWPAETATATNGGTIDTGTPVTEGLSQIFLPGVSSFLGGAVHSIYRKIFIRNDDGDPIQGLKVFLDNMKYPGQVKIAMEASGGDTSVDPRTSPAAYTFVTADGQANAIPKVVGGLDLAVSASVGLWINLQLPAGLQEADPFVPLDIVIIGTR